VGKPAPAAGLADETRSVAEGRTRAVIDAVLPNVDGGRFAPKRIAGEAVSIEAHCFTDGHDKLRVLLRWGLKGAAAGSGMGGEVAMAPLPNDVWIAEFTPPQPGRYQYTVIAWVDHFESWRHELERREDRADIAMAVQVGAALIDSAAERASGSDAAILREWSGQLRGVLAAANTDVATARALALDPARAGLVARYADRTLAASSTWDLIVDRKRAGFSSWYELFPRSMAAQAGQHGTFSDVEKRLPYLAEMGFDVLYFPPIHPIGRVNRKGTNNSLRARPGDVGSPWAIGSSEGGHKEILPQLGTFEDFDRLVNVARGLGLEIAMDIAFQCAPDHPYVTEHPQWFKRRPDGSVQYAENPPKKYQDIYPFDFETSDWRGLWNELKSVVDFWIAHGVRIFRVDNPHTKAFAFWQWLIETTKQAHPDIIYLAGFHAAEGYAPLGKTGILPVIHLFHVA
jgi:starch synthase (maltosyl-transferring)